MISPLKFPFNLLNLLEIFDGKRPAGITPVSYTHLDVYKRQQFINKIAGVKSTYSLSDISERIMGELSGIVAEAVLEGRQNVGLNALVSLQANSRRPVSYTHLPHQYCQLPVLLT